jgi:hypothetical protein
MIFESGLLVGALPDSSGEDTMRKRILCATLVGVCLCCLWGCSTRESEPKTIQRDPFKERRMSPPKG